MNKPDRQGQAIAQESPDEICAVADALREGDEVSINDRTRSVTVTRRDEDLGITPIGQMSDYPYKVVWLEGNGTEYRLKYSHTGEYFPTLYSAGQLRESSSNFQHQDFDDTLVDQSSKMIPKRNEHGERVQKLVPTAVDSRQNLADFVLTRNIEVVEDAE